MIGTDGPLHLRRQFDSVRIVNARRRTQKDMTKVTSRQLRAARFGLFAVAHDRTIWQNWALVGVVPRR